MPKLKNIFFISFFILNIFCEDVLLGKKENTLEEHVFSVKKYVLDNGLTLLIRKTDLLKDVACYLAINVGSKDEEDGIRGYAHIVEHSLFKGTKKFAEPDMWKIKEKLSANFNAFTSFDKTVMTLNFPIDSYMYAFPILAECFAECRFNQDFLNSEFKAIVQELRMRNNDPSTELFQKILKTVYSQEHPYYHPIIGYKLDIINATSEKLKKFYKKHYVPNNAVLVVVGNVDEQEVLSLVKENFGSIPADSSYQKKNYNIQNNLQQQNIIVHQNISVPQISFCFHIPGGKYIDNLLSSHVLNILSFALTENKNSRLYKKLIDDFQLVNSISVGKIGLCESDLFFIDFEPRNIKDVETIKTIILKELEEIALNGCSSEELTIAHKNFKNGFYNIFESNSSQASSILNNYLLTKDENFIFKLSSFNDLELINKKIKEFVSNYLRPELMHTAQLLPFTEDKRKEWQDVQSREDQEDEKLFQNLVRKSSIEDGKFVNSISVNKFKIRDYPNPDQNFVLKNGIKVLCYKRTNIPKINFTLKLKPDGLTDFEEEFPGTIYCLNKLMKEGGTLKRSAQELEKELDRLGVNWSGGATYISADLMSEDLPQTLNLLQEFITQPALNATELPKIKTWLKTETLQAWDSEENIGNVILSNLVNSEQNQINKKDKNNLPEFSLYEIDKIKHEQLLTAYKKFISPKGATIVLVGDLEKHTNLQELLENTFGSWNGPEINDFEYPKFNPSFPNLALNYFDKDQIVLKMGALSIDRNNSDYNALNLYNKNLNSRLFNLREQTGIFYHAAGDILSGTTRKSCGNIEISTMVSPDRLYEAIALLQNFISEDYKKFSEEDLFKAKQSLIHNSDLSYSSNDGISSKFLYLNEWKLPFDYFQKYAQEIESVTVEDVKKAAQKYLDPRKLHIALVGRVGAKNKCHLMNSDWFQKPDTCLDLNLLAQKNGVKILN